MVGEEAQYEDDGIVSSTGGQRCPPHCPIFDCVLIGKCTMACENLDVTKGIICDLCAKDESCSKKRRMALLDMSYFAHVKELRTDESTSRIEEVKAQHRHMELTFQEVKKKMYATSWFSMSKKTGYLKEGRALKSHIRIYREVMDMLGIDYKKNVEIGDEK